MLIADKRFTASFDVDVQRVFAPLGLGEEPAAEAERMVAALNQQAGLADWRLASKDAHGPMESGAPDDPERIEPGMKLPDPRELWPVRAIVGTEGFQSLPGLPPARQYDFLVWKGLEPGMHPRGACFHDRDERISTGVIEWLMARTISTVLVGGIATEFSVRATALQLVRTGFTAIVNLAACRGFADDTVDEALNELREAGVIVVEDTSMLKQLK